MSADDDQAREIQLETLLELAHNSMIDGLRTCLPGVITEYDKDQQRASVQVLIQHGELVGGDRQVAPITILNDIPVWFLGPARARTTYPVAAGDVCLVMWASSNISQWKVLGAPNGPVDPGDDTRHRLSDAVCIVGGHSFNDPPTDAPTDAIVTHLDDGVVQKFGSSAASNKVLTTSDGNALLYAIAYAYNQLNLSSDPSATAMQQLYGALTGGASPPPTPTSPPSWPVGTSKILTDL